MSPLLAAKKNNFIKSKILLGPNTNSFNQPIETFIFFNYEKYCFLNTYAPNKHFRTEFERYDFTYVNNNNAIN